MFARKSSSSSRISWSDSNIDALRRLTAEPVSVLRRIAALGEETGCSRLARMNTWSAETWTDPQWLAAAHAWIGDVLAQTGTTGLRSARRSTCARGRPSSACRPRGRPLVQGEHAGARATRLRSSSHSAERRPDCVPPLRGVDVDRGWLLMTDAGAAAARNRRTETGPLAVARDPALYAGLQLDVAATSERLVAGASPKLRLSTLPTGSRLVGEHADLPDDDAGASTGAGRWCGSCAPSWRSTECAETIEHDDSTTGRSTCVTAATCCSTGVTPVSRIRSSRWR